MERKFRHPMLFVLAAAGWLSFGSGALCTQAADDSAEFFEKRVRPVLMDQCFKCHGGEKTKAGLKMDSRASLLKGGTTGPAIVSGNPKQSLLIQSIRYEHEDYQMPPKKPLPASVVADFEKWVKDGAVWPGNAAQTLESNDPTRGTWSLQPLSDTKLPSVSNKDWSKAAMDRFILAKLEAAGLEPVGQADKRSLIRRAYFDLIGLPPTIAQVQAFLRDDSPQAFATVIDRLLASPEYGRRWGRHWLDVARYADTSGDGTDMPIKEARLYRDYVIDAFNNDMPFDQFVREQIAGDVLAKRQAAKGKTDRYPDQVIATGFVALSRRFGNGKFADMHLVVDETLDTIGKGMLGLTISCARCHDHKFDPVSQEDYYSLAGYFTSTQYPHAGTESGREPSNFVALSPEGDAVAKHASMVAELSYRISRVQRNVSKYNKPEDRKELAEKKAELAELKKSKPKGTAKLAWAVSDKTSQDVGDAPMMIRGDPHKLGKKVTRGFITSISKAKPDIADDASGRLELANWIASPSNPLTARVIVNRIWQWHFGKGIVASASNFGHQGKTPTHPNLLDFLASQFIADGWSIKRLHRKIMLSNVYQLASTSSSRKAASADPTNKLYWRFDRRRLDAESIRDGVMYVAGTLDLSTPGAHPFPDIMKTRFTQHRPFQAVYSSKARTVYLMTQRLHKHPYLALFDGPDTNKSTAERNSSTVPLQALFLMNSSLIKTQSAAFGKRIQAASKDDGERVRFAYEAALVRSMDESDVAEAVKYVKDYAAVSGNIDDAWASFAKLLLVSNGFMYVD